MTLCRVFQPEGAPVQVTYPSPFYHREHDGCPGCEAMSADIAELPEAERQALTDQRLEATAEALGLANVPWVDIDSDDLPSRDRREQWRLVDGRVVVDEAAPSPLRDAAEQRAADQRLLTDTKATIDDRLAAFARLLGAG